MKKILLIDNFDSFTFNLVHYLEGLNCSVEVFRNNELNTISLKSYDALVISPGPGLPTESNELVDFLKRNYGAKPMLGVCLGMQALLNLKGYSIYNMPKVKHGIQTEIQTDSGVLFDENSNNAQVALYHSWAGKTKEILEPFTVKATMGEWAMAIEDPKNQVYGVQFHPESILTPSGKTILQNWLNSF